MRRLSRIVKRLREAPWLVLPSAFEPSRLIVAGMGISDGCVAVEGAGLDPMTVWIFRERRDHGRLAFPIGRDVRSAWVLSVAREGWAVSVVDQSGSWAAPDEIDLELVAAVVDALVGFLPACDDLLLGLTSERVERAFLHPGLPRIGLVRLSACSTAPPAGYISGRAVSATYASTAPITCHTASGAS
jgi:hypothetical protein